MGNTKEIKTVEELFNFLQKKGVECYSTTVQWEKHFILAFVTPIRDCYFQLEYFTDIKGKGFYLYDCFYYTEEEMVKIMLEEVNLIFPIK
ncbi:MAG: hypothetical protein EBS55_15010 [Flavobacteriaceae bacterium]|nr:hypothetical protein [Flavobacteriaceae bacterium]